MRSLAVKLSLAFLFVGVLGVVLVALFVRQRTGREFDQFVLNRDQANFVEVLEDYYANNGSWEGIREALRRDGRPPQRPFRLPVTLADENGLILRGDGRYRNAEGRLIQPAALPQAQPIQVGGRTVGWAIFEPPPNPALGLLEAAFLVRLDRAILVGALGATGIAVLLGLLLARTLSRPILELTAATRAIAEGNLDQRVTVQSQDELGELAAAFNQMSADLAHASHLRRQMTADIAHDLRTPLSVILGYTEALDEGKLQGNPDIYHVLHSEAQHLDRLIDDLRVLALADAGELSLARRPVAPRALLERIALAHVGKAEERGITLALEAAAELPLLDVDPDRMTQVLGNLVSNALRHTPAGGTITLSAAQEGAAVIVRVTDTGEGIDAEDLPHIFERFYRADKARQPGGESGLGLAIARSIVEAHGGKIAAESAPERGTEVTITLTALR